MKKSAWCLAAALWLSGCGLVDETYASIDRKSINGIDVFVALLAEVGDVERVAHVSKRVLGRADLLVHFDRGRARNPHYWNSVEAWLQKLPLPPPPASPAAKGEKHRKKKGRADAKGKRDAKSKTEKKHKSKKGDSGTVREEDSAGEARAFVVPERPRTLLYVAFDTTASVPFWRRLARQMKGHAQEESWCRAQLEGRLLLREATSVTPVIFGQRAIRHARARTFPTAGGLAGAELRWPVRQVPGPVRSQGGVPLPARAVLVAEGGPALVRVARAPAARLVLVYNGAPLLNYSLVRAAEREFARRLVALSLASHRSGRPKIVLVTADLMPAAAAARERNLLKILATFPISVILAHLLALLLLFLFARWPHEQTPLDVAPRGTRAFLEHIEALGSRLARTRGRAVAVRGIKRLIARQRRFRGQPEPAFSPEEPRQRYSNAELLREAAQYWEHPKE